MDLTSLGTVSSVMFTLSSSDVGQWGMNTPGYVCVDNFNAPLEVLPTSIELNYEDEAIIDLGGQTLQLVATVLPENATNKAVEWTSSNENVAPVDETGLVTAVKNGTWSVIPRIQSLDVEPASAVITAISVANPEVSKSVTVVISNPTGVRDIDASKEVKEVKYVNAAGMESYKPFEGVNIIITTFTDGSRTTTKVIK
ncbi:MAG: Ig-like domain-containing protein [Muribaculaceae bacterium]|nr:Ig-like domain-containing protein [Muribaculaceae bacterium]